MPTEEQTDSGLMPEKPAEDSGGKDVPDWAKDPVKAYEEVLKTRREAAAERVKRQELEKRVSAAPAKDESQLTELAKRVEQAEKRAAESERKALITSLAAEYKLPAALAARLQGDSEEALRKDAEALAALVPAAPVPPAQMTKPAPNGIAEGETIDQKRARLLGAGAGGVNPITGRG